MAMPASKSVIWCLLVCRYDKEDGSGDIGHNVNATGKNNWWGLELTAVAGKRKPGHSTGNRRYVPAKLLCFNDLLSFLKGLSAKFVTVT